MQRGLVFSFLVLASLPAFAQREPVLKQIDLPHPYYFREMYLPQLTTGPSSASWLPDSRGLVYSMAGSLWRQNLDSTNAEELTAGPGYDYQPDCSPDGRWVIYAKYSKDAVELWALDLRSKEAHALTHSGAVNLEARLSPDGMHVVFVSTVFNKRFHVFEGEFHDGQLTNIRRLTGENRSPLSRYYYSAFDTEISPAWAPSATSAASEIVYVSNRGHIYGTGGFWLAKAEPNAEAREIHYEETTWKAQPEFSPDGKRLVYASYAGRSWHQLWMMPSQGGDPLQLTYGEYDNTTPRWSPDGKQIAFVSNRGGNTSLWTVHVPGGDQHEIIAHERRYLRPVGRLTVRVVGENGKAAAARISVTGSDGRAYAPDDAWMQADDSFERRARSEEVHYFDTTGVAALRVPVGNVDIEIMKGFEYEFEKRSVMVHEEQNASLTIRLKPILLPEAKGERWVSGDVHVHMNYAGTYRNTPEHLVQQARAEDLSIIQNLIVNKEQRILDMSYFSPKQDSASTLDTLLLHGQEYHTSYWGHLGLLNLTDHFLLPGYVAYTNTAAASLYPSNADIADMAHAQHGLVGYVHPFDDIPNPQTDASLTDELPVDVALGKVDYIEVLGFSDHKSTAAVWYRLLNCGFHLPAAAGTDAMANYASLRGPVGLNRVYARVKTGSLETHSWLDSLKRGDTFATNGPLLEFKLGGKTLGETLRLPAKTVEVNFSATLRSLVPLDHLQVVCNGRVVRDLQLLGEKKAGDFNETLPMTQSGWCLLRAWSEKPENPILDIYPYATTSPIYVQAGESRSESSEDATYFIAWIDRLIEAAKSHSDWNSDAEMQEVLDLLERGRKVYEAQRK